MGSIRKPPHNGHAPRKTSNAAFLHSKKPSDHNPLAGLFAKPPLPPTSRDAAGMSNVEPSSSGDPASSHIAMPKPAHVNHVLNRAKEEDPQRESWDDDFASDRTFANMPRKDKHETKPDNDKPTTGSEKRSDSSEDDNQDTLRPGRSPTPGLPASAESKKASALRAVSTSVIEDYSDITTGEDDGGLAAKLANLKVRQVPSCIKNQLLTVIVATKQDPERYFASERPS